MRSQKEGWGGHGCPGEAGTRHGCRRGRGGPPANAQRSGDPRRAPGAWRASMDASGVAGMDAGNSSWPAWMLREEVCPGTPGHADERTEGMRTAHATGPAWMPGGMDAVPHCVRAWMPAFPFSGHGCPITWHAGMDARIPAFRARMPEGMDAVPHCVRAWMPAFPFSGHGCPEQLDGRQGCRQRAKTATDQAQCTGSA
jgi:hypothetical protein